LNKSKKRWRWNAGEEGTPMLRVHVETAADAEQSTTLDELVAEGARRMLAAALEAEVDAYVTALSDEHDGEGHRLVVRNGHAVARSLVTGAGPIEVRAPRVDDRRVDEATGEKVRFRSSILPPWARKSPKVAEVLPLMYLHGMSSGDFVPALEEFFGSATGLSASVTLDHVGELRVHPEELGTEPFTEGVSVTRLLVRSTRGVPSLRSRSRKV